jgi:hypothetical protein
MCKGQIVWFFKQDKPTVLVCAKCEITADCYTQEKCVKCGRPMVHFTANMSDVLEAQNDDEEGED